MEKFLGRAWSLRPLVVVMGSYPRVMKAGWLSESRRLFAA